MLQNIAAIEHDGLDTRVITITLKIPDKTFDTAAAVRAACTEFCKTDEGLNIYRGNCDCFNWADFAAYVPNAICQKHGFTKIDSDIVSDLEVNLDEHIVDDSQIEPDNEDDRWYDHD